MRICTICKVSKNIVDFPTYKNGYDYRCNICVKEYKKRWYQKNKKTIKIKQKEWYNTNQDKIKEKNKNRKHLLSQCHKRWYEKNKEKNKEYHRQWYKKNRKSIRKKPKRSEYQKKLINNEYQRKRKNNDPIYKFKCNIRTAINNLLKNRNFIKKSRTFDIVGCSFEELKSYLESKWEPWMNWDNYGKYSGELDYGWDLDHIIPISSAKTEEEIIKLNHHSNLQPLCSYINRFIKKDSQSFIIK